MNERRRSTPPLLLVAPWKRALAMVAPVAATIMGAAMAVQWALGAGDDFRDGPPGAATVGRWMAEHLPLMDGGDPVWAWRGPFAVSLLLALPFVWQVTGRVASSAARWSTRAGLLLATAAIALEYNSPGYGWMFDLAFLLAAIMGSVACGVSGLRTRSLQTSCAWALISALPLTPIAGFLTFWYLPPGLTIGLLLAFAAAAALAGSEPPR